MLGNFTFHNPTKLYFGKNALDGLYTELPEYGKTVVLVYGGGSIKKNGIYDAVIKVLKDCNKTVVEDSGVMPNPTAEKLRGGAAIAREANADLILAVGGGSVCDYAKAVSASAHCGGDPWEYYYERGGKDAEKIIPVGCVLTMVGTGSEMNATSVITNEAEKMKMGHTFGERVFPKFSILNPEFTYSLPEYQMVAGIYDVMSHVLEQYLSGEDDNVSDYLSEGLLRSLISSAAVAVKKPTDYEARSNIMWAASWALNTLLSRGKSGDWEVHMLGQAVGAHTDATHGMTLSAVTMPYYRHILPYGEKKFARLATTVWGVSPEGKTERETAEEGLAVMEKWMRDLGLVMNISALGATREMLDGLVESTRVKTGGYKVLEKSEIREIFLKSF